jgi:chemotaxis protein methyltransferase CheR
MPMTTPLTHHEIAGPSPASALSPQSYAYLQSYIHRESGIVLDDDKQYLFAARLLPLVQSEKLASLNELCDRVASGRAPLLAAQVTEAMTTNETLFFRDAGIFESMKTIVFPALLEATRGERKIRIWSAAASTGQEAYSIAMSLLAAGIRPHQVEIVATDLSEQVLARARAGRYVQFEISRGLPTPLLLKHFSKVGLDWQIDAEVRGMVRFEKMDLRGSLAGIGACDLVLCRNVLIYFNADTKRQILASIARTLNPGGLLVLGCAETLLNLDHGFDRKAFGQSTFYKVR